MLKPRLIVGLIKEWKVMRRCFSLFFGLLSYLVAMVSLAQTASDSEQQLQSALQAGDMKQAMIHASALYVERSEAGDDMGAGGAAFAKARIFQATEKPGDAAKAFKQCADHYERRNAAAQSLQCRFFSGQAHIVSGKRGTGVGLIKKTARQLETIGQQNSGFAGQVYLALAKEILPSKVSFERGADRKREQALSYADKALSALKASQLTQTEYYPAALALKAKALEDGKQLEAALSAYDDLQAYYKDRTDAPKEAMDNVSARMSIIKSMMNREKGELKPVTARLKSGEEIKLEIKAKNFGAFPKVNKNQLVDGARSVVEITLKADGTVDTVDIVESYPDPIFGETFRKAVLTWQFVLPEGLSGLDVAPFEHSRVFYVYRR